MYDDIFIPVELQAQTDLKQDLSKVELFDDYFNWKSENFPDDINNILRKSKGVLLTGSKYICPGEVFNDIDIVLLDAPLELVDSTWVDCGQYEPTEKSKYRIVRKEMYNLICTNDVEEYNKWVLSTHIAKRLKLTSKEDRKFLFTLLRADISYGH